jgi:hypothetical protein
MTESLDTSLVDRLWEAWMAVRGRLDRPTAQDPAPAGHRLDDVMTTLLGEAGAAHAGSRPVQTGHPRHLAHG